MNHYVNLQKSFHPITITIALVIIGLVHTVIPNHTDPLIVCLIYLIMLSGVLGLSYGLILLKKSDLHYRLEGRAMTYLFGSCAWLVLAGNILWWFAKNYQ